MPQRDWGGEVDAVTVCNASSVTVPCRRPTCRGVEPGTSHQQSGAYSCKVLPELTLFDKQLNDLLDLQDRPGRPR